MWQTARNPERRFKVFLIVENPVIQSSSALKAQDMTAPRWGSCASVLWLMKDGKMVDPFFSFFFFLIVCHNYFYHLLLLFLLSINNYLIDFQPFLFFWSKIDFQFLKATNIHLLNGYYRIEILIIDVALTGWPNTNNGQQTVDSILCFLPYQLWMLSETKVKVAYCRQHCVRCKVSQNAN